MQNFLATLAALAIFDGLWLGLVARKFYRSQLGALMANRPNWAAAIIFYLIYTVGVTVFVVNGSDSPVEALWRGALFGLVAYATYDLTNQATLANWPRLVTVVDLAWGTVMTALVGYLVTLFLNR